MKYSEFIAAKRVVVPEAGFAVGRSPAISNRVFPFQRANVEWACRRGRAALFLDTGLGKTIQQLEWARQVAAHTGRSVLILAPLAVSKQTVREGEKFGIAVKYAADQGEAGAAIVITNYERLDRFDPSKFGGVVLDESSILKSYSGATKRALLEAFASTPFKLACTATPAPNDHLELGNHAEFLGVLTSHEMIARWFINDASTFGTYRLKGHAVTAFWDWVSSWAAMASLPSDLGEYSDDGYVLPALNTRVHEVAVDVAREGGPHLFRMPDLNATSIHAERRRTAGARADKVAALVSAEPAEQWLIWCETDYEADAITAVLPAATEVRGSDTPERKEKALIGFADGEVRVLVTKPKLAGFGLNFQDCARVAFLGATFSFEAYYQAIRRTWRFGQRRPVDAHVVLATTERAVWDVMQRKAADFDEMKRQMMAAARRARQQAAPTQAYAPARKAQLPRWMKCA